jgi:hypothetical protein
MGGMRELVRTMRRYCIAISATLTSSRTHLVQFIQQVITSGGNVHRIHPTHPIYLQLEDPLLFRQSKIETRQSSTTMLLWPLTNKQRSFDGTVDSVTSPFLLCASSPRMERFPSVLPRSSLLDVLAVCLAS